MFSYSCFGLFEDFDPFETFDDLETADEGLEVGYALGINIFSNILLTA